MIQIIKKAVRKFIQLDDTPSSFSGLAGKFMKVNNDETALEASTNTDSEIADAVNKRHTQNTDHIIKDADGDTSVDTETSADEDKIRFKTAGSERVTIDENGNVGIGTTNPQHKLEVNGDVYFGDYSKSTNGYTKLPNGLILQWGKYVTNSNNPVTITFPISFPNAVFSVVIAISDSWTVTTAGKIKSLDTTSFEVEVRDDTGALRHTDYIYWMAIGY